MQKKNLKQERSSKKIRTDHTEMDQQHNATMSECSKPRRKNENEERIRVIDLPGFCCFFADDLEEEEEDERACLEYNTKNGNEKKKTI